MRVFSVLNLVLWFVLLVAWVPYLLQVGLGDPVSTQVIAILIVTAGLMAFLAAYRIRGRRHILG
jgi:multisubunit Na+/H+ antiporter MnhF subunit